MSANACPFCGGLDVSVDFVSQGFWPMYRARCASCHATGGLGQCWEEALDLWNKRSSFVLPANPTEANVMYRLEGDAVAELLDLCDSVSLYCFNTGNAPDDITRMRVVVEEIRYFRRIQANANKGNADGE